jgi:hypothetical protein
MIEAHRLRNTMTQYGGSQSQIADNNKFLAHYLIIVLCSK